MNTENKAISLNAMPPKFRGESSKDSTIPDTDQFRNAYYINSWSDTELILGSWFEGEALRWHFNEKKKENARSWTLDLWLDQLLEAFPVEPPMSQGREFTVFGLASLHPHVGESIKQFHVRFNSYLKKIEKKMYTEGLIQDCYLKILRIHREQLWMLVSDRCFQHIKLLLTSEPILQLPNFEEKLFYRQMHPHMQ